MKCIGILFLDTGPLLCLGGLLVEKSDKRVKSRKGAKGHENKAAPRFLGLLEMYDQKILKDARVVKAVRDELVGHSRRSVYEDGSYGHGGPAERVAAQKVLKRYSDSLVDERNVCQVSNDALLHDIQDSLRRRSAAKAGKRDSACAPKNVGEAHTIRAILDTGDRSVSFVSNDTEAKREADDRGIPTFTFVDLMCQLTKCDKRLKRNKVFNALVHVRAQGLDIGKYVTNVMDLPC